MIKTVKIATWNVNSLKVRLTQVLNWLDKEKPEIVGLQELKLDTPFFPHAAFRELGYYSAVNGQKTYNGVALVSRSPCRDIEQPDHDEQRRMIAGTLFEDIRIINLYIPNGESLESLKYQYKLKWLENLKQYLNLAKAHYSKIIIMGDFNIAPTDHDVYDPESWKGKVLCSEPERAVFSDIIGSGFCDSFRLFEQEPNSYSWWDYRMAGFRRNLGMRIDHVLVSEALKMNCESCVIDKAPRGLERPSDHTPVVLSLRIV